MFHITAMPLYFMKRSVSSLIATHIHNCGKSVLCYSYITKVVRCSNFLDRKLPQLQFENKNK